MSDSDDDFKPPPPSIPYIKDNSTITDSDSDDDFVPPPPPPDIEFSDNDASVDDDDDSLAGSDIDICIEDYNISPVSIMQTNSLSPNQNALGQNTQQTALIDDDDISDGDDDDSDHDENYLQKFDESLKSNTISSFHPELLHHNNEEVEALSRIIRNEQGIISDPLHVTFPFITKYERARVLGERAKQLSMGAKPMIEVGPDVIDGYLIALSEYEQKRIPFIIKRPLPNGGCEYWKFKDLETI